MKPCSAMFSQFKTSVVGLQPFHQAPPLHQTFSKISSIELELSNNMHLTSANARHPAGHGWITKSPSWMNIIVHTHANWEQRFHIACYESVLASLAFAQAASENLEEKVRKEAGLNLRKNMEKPPQKKRDRQKWQKHWIAEGKTGATRAA